MIRISEDSFEVVTIPVSRHGRFWLGILLLVSLLLRIELAMGGGQFYWPDETRYEISRDAVVAARDGRWSAVAENLLGTSDHLFFRYLGLVPAQLERMLFAKPPAWFAAIFFGLFSVGAIFIVWLIVRQRTRSETSASWSAFFYGGCVTAFYFNRHYFPYDPALFFLLLGWWWGLWAGYSIRYFGAGFLIGLGYLTYNAYWNVGGLVLVFLVWEVNGDWRQRLLAALKAASGLVTPVALFFGAAAIAGYDLIEHAKVFSRTVTQGDFGRGWYFIPTYFAQSEGWYAIFVICVALAGMISARMRRVDPLGERWVLMGVVLAAEMIFFSDVVPRFAVAGRMAKPIMLFFAMGAGAMTPGLVACRPRLFGSAVALMVVLLAAANISAVLRVVFPEDFQLKAESVAGELLKRQPEAMLQLQYVGFMHRPNFVQESPPHEEILRQPHPLQYRPYQFDGYDESMRAAFSSHDFAMRLIRLKSAMKWHSDAPPTAAEFAPFAGVLEMRLTLPEPRPVGSTEPLIVTGQSGFGDLISVRYEDSDHLSLISDHWGIGAYRSEKFAVPAAAGRVHVVKISAGSLLPPLRHPFMRANPAIRPLSNRLVAEWDGRVVASIEASFFKVPLGKVTLATNLIGGTSCGPVFTGQILDARRCDPRQEVQRGWGVDAPGRDPGGWLGQPGPLKATFTWPSDGRLTKASQAIVFSASRSGESTMVTARDEGAGVVFSLWVDRKLVSDSEPVPIVPGSHEVEIWSPLLMPAIDLVDGQERGFAEWTHQHFAMSLDGQSVFARGAVAITAYLKHTLATRAKAARGLFAWGEKWPLGEGPAAERFPVHWDKIVPQDVRVAELTRLVLGRRLREMSGTQSSDHLGPIAVRTRLSALRPAVAEPLVTTGRQGVGDVIYLIYEPGNRVRVAHDHWGWKPLISESVELSADDEHVFKISMGSLFPDLSTPYARKSGDGIRRNGIIFVSVNDRPLLIGEREFFVTRPNEVAVGINLIGAGSCSAEFGGDILEVTRLDREKDLPSLARFPDR